MAERIVPCGLAPLITVQAKDNLSVQGEASSQIKIMTEDLHELTVEENENGLRIACDEDCALTIPANARLVVEEVEGSASIAEVAGAIQIHKVHGNLSLSQVGDVECREVDGNLWVDRAGRLKIDALGGNLKGGRLSGVMSARGVGGNVQFIAVAGMDYIRAGGNVRLSLTSLQSDAEIKAGGNVRVNLPPNSAFFLDATSGGQNVTVDLGDEPKKINGSTVGLRFGAGGPRLILTAGGNITLSDRSVEDAEGFEFGQDVDWKTLNDRIQRRIEEKIRLVEQRTAAEQRRAEMRVQRAMKKVQGIDLSEIFGGTVNETDWQGSQEMAEQQPEGVSEPVTDAEKMLVLTMLQEKKITAEEAERLLDALAGKFD